MKKLVAILIIIGVLLQSLSTVVILAQYMANKDYIAKNLCENRDKPQMHCDGKCCLKKKLAKEAKQNAPTPRNQKNQQIVTLFFSENKLNFQLHSFFAAAKTYFSYNELATANFHHSVFHPPTV